MSAAYAQNQGADQYKLSRKVPVSGSKACCGGRSKLDALMPWSKRIMSVKFIGGRFVWNPESGDNPSISECEGSHDDGEEKKLNIRARLDVASKEILLWDLRR